MPGGEHEDRNRRAEERSQEHVTDEPHRIDRQVVDNLVPLSDDGEEEPGKHERQRHQQTVPPIEVNTRNRDEDQTKVLTNSPPSMR